MPEETVDPGLLEQTKNQIRKLVAEIADLAESDMQPSEFYVEFLNRSIAAVAASGGALWLLDAEGQPQAPASVGVPAHRPDGRPGPDPAARRPPGVHDPGVAAADHPAGGGGRGGPQRRQPHQLFADHRADDGGQAGGRARRDPDGPDAAGGHPEEHAPLRQRPVRPGRHVPEESPDAADDVAAAALESARRIHAPDPRLARPEGGRVRRRQRRQAAGRLRPPERRDEDRRPGERPGGQRPGGRRAAGQPDPRADEGSARSRSARARTSSTPATPRGSPPTSATRWSSTSTSRARSRSSSRSCTSPRPSRTRTGSPSAAWSPSRSATSWPRPTCTPGPRSSRGTPRRRSGTRRSTTRSSCCRCSS